jgi:Na+-transporting NADH:ubiquinone oxidoreductase subunit NqrB
MWLLGGSWRIHSVLLTYLLVFVPFQLLQPFLVPEFVLQNTRLLVGDLLHATDAPDSFSITPWYRASPIDGADALRRPAVATQLSLYTLGVQQPDRAWTSMQMLIRDRLPPLEDLIVGGLPAALGTGSAVGVVIGGLFLLYRGIIDWRIPLLTVLAAWIALLVLPVPIVITERGPVWQWLALRESAAGWGVAMTFAHYELLASPLLFVAFFLATSPSIRPMSRRARTLYAALLGVCCAAAQLHVGASVGPIVALAAVGLLTPVMDRVWKRP